MAESHLEVLVMSQTQSLVEALRLDRQQEQLKLLKFKEVRDLLWISRATLWRMVHRGQIKVQEVVPGIKRMPIAEIQRIAAGKGGAGECA